MKSNWLLILLIIVAGNTIHLATSLRFGNPSIEFNQNDDYSGKKNDGLYIYSIKLRSNEKLLKFEVTPSVKGANIDSEINYCFDENTHQAVLNYFYVLPNDLNSDEVVLTFRLTDSKESNVRKEVIKLYNPVNHYAKSDTKTIKTRI